jgi:hypothetical protein
LPAPARWTSATGTTPCAFAKPMDHFSPSSPAASGWFILQRPPDQRPLAPGKPRHFYDGHGNMGELEMCKDGRALARLMHMDSSRTSVASSADGSVIPDRLVSVNLGLGLSIAGGIIGGWHTDRVGIFKALWVLALWQALSNLSYVAAAYIVPAAPQGAETAFAHQILMYCASAIESFTGGLGTAAFSASLMAIIDKTRATTEHAFLSSIFAFSRSIADWTGGIGAQEMGYAAYFAPTFVLAFPKFALPP